MCAENKCANMQMSCGKIKLIEIGQQSDQMICNRDEFIRECFFFRFIPSTV